MDSSETKAPYPIFQLSKKEREKTDKAVDTVLEEIPPGQGSLPKNKLLKWNRVIDFNKELKKSIESAVGNVKVKFLLLVSGTNDDGQSYDTINELFQIFPSPS